jgi:hypothetical protein
MRVVEVIPPSARKRFMDTSAACISSCGGEEGRRKAGVVYLLDSVLGNDVSRACSAHGLLV